MFSGLGIYGSVRDVAGPAIRPGGMKLTERAISFCRFGSNSRLLDVGSGTGATVRFLRERYYFNAVAIDISPSLIGQRKDKMDILPFILGDARQLPFCDWVMDGITCECVISCLENPELAFAEFARVLRPGGYLILSDLYDRGGNSGEGAECHRGMMPRDVTENLLAWAGFEQVLWEDHTLYLKELAAQLVLNGISANKFLEPAGPFCRPGMSQLHTASVKPGYYLLIARKIS